MLLTVIIVGIVVIFVDQWVKQYQSDQEELEQSIQAFIDSIEHCRNARPKRR